MGLLIGCLFLRNLMNEYLEQTLLNAINSTRSNDKPLENDHQHIVDEDDDVWYMVGWVNGIYSRWTVNKIGGE
jgi:hypothetical protein